MEPKVLDAEVVDEQKELYGGLLMPCERCAKHRALMEVLNSTFRHCVLIGEKLDPQHDPMLNENNCRFVGPFKLECGDCSGRGLVLTVRGKMFVAIVQQWMGKAMPDWLTPGEILF